MQLDFLSTVAAGLLVTCLTPTVCACRNMQALLLAPGQVLMADSAFNANNHVITPIHHRQNVPNRLANNRNFSRQRVEVEHLIGDLKVYTVVGGKYRGSRAFLPHVANVVMALTNRRRRLIMTERLALQSTFT